jgi:hypothetical protein
MSAGKSQANSLAVSVIIPAYMTADLEPQIEPYRHRLLYIRQENQGAGSSCCSMGTSTVIFRSTSLLRSIG